MEESSRDRKRNSARKKSEFSVYSQKAVRAKELLQRAKPVVVQKSNDNAFIGQKICPVQVKNATNQKDTKK
jgi:hypothetical protein